MHGRVENNIQDSHPGKKGQSVYLKMYYSREIQGLWEGTWDD